jgi:hypothetical protein
MGIELGAQVTEEHPFRMLGMVQTLPPENRLADPLARRRRRVRNM